MKEELKMMALIESINTIPGRDNIHAELYSDDDGIVIVRVEDYDNEENSFECPYSILKEILGI